MNLNIVRGAVVMKRNSATLVVGGPTGVPALVKDILYQNRDRFRYGVAMSGNTALTQTLNTFMPPASIFNGFSEPVVQKLMSAPKAGKEMFVVVEPPSVTTKLTLDLAMNARHKNLAAMYIVPNTDALPDTYGGQFDFVFIGQGVNIESAWRSYAVDLELDVFKKVYNMCTDDGGYMMLKKGKETSVHWYTPRVEVPDFSVGTDPFGLLDIV